MLSSKHFLVVSLLWAGAARVQAESPPTKGAPQAVYVEVCVTEQDVNRVGELVDDPIMQVFKPLSGVGHIWGAMTHGQARFQLAFKGGATEDDRSTVEATLGRITFDREVEVLSVSVQLGDAQPDNMFAGRSTCHLKKR